MCNKALYAAVTSLIVASSFRIKPDFSKIEIYPKEVIPTVVDTLENTEVKGSCGSLSPVSWTYKRNRPTLNEYFHINVTHYFGSNLPPSRHDVENNSIIITNVQLYDSGYYYCFGTYINHFGDTKQFQKSFQLNVWLMVPFGYVLPSVTHVSEGGNVTFKCGSSGKIEWFGRTMNSQEKYLANNSILLYNLGKSNSGPYVCRGVHINGIVFHARADLFVDSLVFLNNIAIFEP